ncbi:hypothetical protein BH09PLA1_BH09PLA1_02240 [soil metagenome]
MRALSIRQPFAELILRGIKTVEYRSRATSIVGERFYIYASKAKSEIRNPKSERNPKHEIRMPKFGRGIVADGSTVLTADNIVVPDAPLPEWMIELAEQVKMIPPGTVLPRGVIVGSAVIERVEEVRVQSSEFRKSPALNSELCPLNSVFKWHLTDVQRATKLRKPTGHPQPVWFKPFG